MAAIILSEKFVHADQDFEISVKYDIVLQKPVEVKNILLHVRGAWYPVGSIMDKFFHDAVWKLINETDWTAIYNELCTPARKRQEAKLNLHPVL